MEVPADPAAGFNYEFYLLIPPGLQAGDSTRRLVEPNNTGTVDDDDTLSYDDAYNPAERKVALAVLGESMEKRWQCCQELYRGAVPAATRCR